MEVNSIRLKNYRSIKEDRVDFSNLTVLIGKNNSGKSNFIDALRTYSLIILENLTPQEKYEEFVCNSQKGMKIGFDVRFELNDEEREAALSTLHKVDNLDKEFVKHTVDSDFFKTFRHEIEFNNNEIIKNRISTNYQDKWLVVSSFHHCLPFTGQLGYKQRKKWWDFSRDTFGEDVENGVYRLDFSVFPDKRKLKHIDSNVPNNVAGIFPEYISDEIVESINSWSHIDPFREPKNEVYVTKDLTLDESGQNLARVLLTISQNQPEKFQRIVDTYVEVMEGVENIRAPIISSEEPQVTLEIDEAASSEPIRLKDISSGSKEILTLITKVVLSSSRSDFITLEEPELHLHPSAEMKILELIEDVVKSSQVQVLISTHSDVFVNHIEAGHIIRTIRQEYTEFKKVADGQLATELEDLGYSKSDLFQSEGILFVEGRSDRIIINVLSDVLGKSLEINGIETIIGRGDELESDMPAISKVLHQMRIPYLVLLDSDGKNTADKREEAASKMEISPENILVLEKYSIESYLTECPEAISRTIDENVDEIQDFIDSHNSENKKKVLDDLYKNYVGTGYHEEKNGATIAKNMEKVEVSEEIEAIIDTVVRMT